MKIKNLLLLGLMAVCGMNAFAVDHKVSGIIYNIATGGKTATVKNVSFGMAEATAKTITIPATFVDGDGNTVKVTGFDANWYTGDGTTTRTITGLTENLSIDVTNIAALAAGAFDDLTKLATITLTGTYAADNFTVNGLAASATKYDLSALKGKDKVIIAASAFSGNAKVATVILPAQATTIGASAFQNATALEGIDLTNVTEIGDNAFDGCNNAKFTSLTITANIAKDKIGAAAFANMTKLTSVTITNNKLEKIGAWFAGDNAVETLSITSTSVKELEANAFADFTSTKFTAIDLSGCSALETVANNSFPQNAYKSAKFKGTKLNDAQFQIAQVWLNGAKATLKEITFPDALTIVGGFANFTALEAIGLPKGLVTISDNAFNGCTGLTSIKIKGYVKEIGDNAFDGCANVIKVDFSDATVLESIGDYAFDGISKDFKKIDLSACAKLEEVGFMSFPYTNEYTSVLLSGTKLAYTDPVTEVYKDDFDNDFIWTLQKSKKSLTEITLPTGLTAINPGLFKDFEALTSVSIPKAVVTIGTEAFRNSGLTAIKIREGVQSIGFAAFENCEALATANFSEATALLSIGDFAFAKTAITEVAIPANAKAADGVTLTIGDGAFAGCEKLKSFSAKSWAGKIAKLTFDGCKKLGGFVVPVGITSIGDYAFRNCAKLATVTFKYGEDDPGLTAIGEGAFAGCESLAALDLSTTNLTALDNDWVFFGCTALAEITLPETMTDLSGDYLFADCPIETLEAPNVTVSSELFGFYWDEDAASYLPRNKKNPNTTLKSVVIGGDIPSDCFAWCTALETVEYVGVGGTIDDYAFEHCLALTTFTYQPEELLTYQAVEDQAFHGCIPFVHFETNKNYMDWCVAYNKGLAPVNASFGGAETTTVKTVQDKANANQFVAKFTNTTTSWAYIDAADAKVFSIYVDGETAYFQALRTSDGKYWLAPRDFDYPGSRDNVIIKTESQKEIDIHYEASSSTKKCVGFDDVYASQEDDDLADVQDGVSDYAGLQAGQYLYRLTNTEDQGFGFTFFTGTTIKEGQFFVGCAKKPEGAGRLNIVWLDEDGNVEGNATAIQKIENNTEDADAIYNLSGQKVNASYKGVVIKNGKKYVK